MSITSNIKSKEMCFHCGANCQSDSFAMDEKIFCCNGCKMVYQIINQNELCAYYDLNDHPGILQTTPIRKEKFAFLDNDEIATKLIQFKDATQTHVTFYLPQIHCSSCLWLLENLHQMNKAISSAKVNFIQKEIFISFHHCESSLRQIVETLVSIGYEPHLQLDNLAEKNFTKIDRTRWYKLGVAGFCFANIMMMSLAEYFSIQNSIGANIKMFFNGASLALSIPVLFYAASEFFVSAFTAIKNKFLNIDVPVALALIITFFRSVYEIGFGISNGYLDSMSGIVFFMLIGRWLQERTYQNISFDRDYKSFFPIAIDVIKNNKIMATSIENIAQGDVIQIHANEVIPIDGILSKGTATIDYSFVNGESTINNIKIGELIYAGAKQTSGLIELIVSKKFSHSYLNNLWNKQDAATNKKLSANIFDRIGKYFTYAVLVVGLFAGIYWYSLGSLTQMWNAITTVLIVACPCALLLASNFTNGHLLNVFGKHQFYLRSANVIEKLNYIQHIVFDKTGTITQSHQSNVKYNGLIMNESVKENIASILLQSNHPLSKAIVHYLNVATTMPIEHFKEIEGKGIEAWHNDTHFKIGSASFVNSDVESSNNGSTVFIKINDAVIGHFIISNKYRYGISNLVQSLKQKYTLSLLSGDNNTELANIEKLLGVDSEIFFNQSSSQKLDYIQQLQLSNRNTMMIGDGLNDAGALKCSDIGIAVAEGGNTFTPTCDAIIDANQLQNLDKFLKLAHAGRNIILFTFVFSAIYNVVGLYYAVQGILSPLIAAILMPCSSITIILLSYSLVQIAQRKYLNNNAILPKSLNK